MYTLIHNLLPKNKRFSFFFFRMNSTSKRKMIKPKVYCAGIGYTTENTHTLLTTIHFSLKPILQCLWVLFYYITIIIIIFWLFMSPILLKRESFCSCLCFCVCALRFSTLKYIFQYIQTLYEKQEQQRQHDNNFLAYFFIWGYPTTQKHFFGRSP